jgi:hypothetical protein
MCRVVRADIVGDIAAAVVWTQYGQNVALGTGATLCQLPQSQELASADCNILTSQQRPRRQRQCNLQPQTPRHPDRIAEDCDTESDCAQCHRHRTQSHRL